MLEKYNLTDKYEPISSGDKIRYFYVMQPNKYGINTMGYKYYYPEEFNKDFKPDVEKMFDKIVYSIIERFYEAVDWRLRRPGMQVQTDLFELLAV
jgi:DNA polymerase elongation subunit (family B)